MNQKRVTVDVIVPLYNCERSIDELVDRIASSASLANLNLHLYLVDDGSIDETWIRLKKVSMVKEIKVTALKFSRNFGQHAAILSALLESEGDYLILMDGDLQDRPEDIPRFIEKIVEDKLDVVRGVLSKEQTKSLKSFPSYLFHAMGGQSGRETSFRAISRRLKDALITEPEASELSGPVIDSLGFKQGEIEIVRGLRKFGTRYTLSKRFDLAINFLLSKSKISAYTFFFLAGATGVLSIIYTTSLLIEVIFLNRGLPPGLNQVVLLLILQMMFLSLGIAILILLALRILTFAKKSPAYHVMEKWQNKT